MKPVQSLIAISAFMALAGCGGGGGGGGGGSTASSTSTTYPFRSGYQNYLNQSEVNNFSITGTCTGSATQTRSAVAAATFEGIPGVSATTTLTGSYSNCTPASFASTGITYYDTNYKPIGAETPGTDYAVYTTSNDLPTSVKVGDTAQFGSIDVYSSSTRQLKTGTRTLSYAVEADTGSTAIINLIAKGYNTYNNLLYTQQTRYRINTTGQLTVVSLDIQYSTNSTSHMVWTKN